MMENQWEIVRTTKENSSKSVFDKKSKIENRNVWALSSIQDQIEWKNDYCLQKMISRTVQTRLSNSIRADDENAFKRTNNDNDRESFHCAMGSILVAAQVFGILPLAGVRSDSPSKLVFKKFSPRIAYTLFIMLMLFAMMLATMCNVVWKVQGGSSGLDGTVGLALSNTIFYFNGLLATIFFLRLAPRWISLQNDWRTMERLLDRDKLERPPRLRRKLSLLMGIAMMLALLEYTGYLVSVAANEISSSASNKTMNNFIRAISEGIHPFIFTICEYNDAIGIFVVTVYTIVGFIWNFNDVFIMVVSTGLVERYKTLNRRLKVAISTCKTVDWRSFRECYASLSLLVKNVDNNISPIILLSIANNLYYICFQLMIGLSPRRTYLSETVYFSVSFVFLVSRAFVVMLLAARVNDQSKIALPELYICPETAYSIEMQRLQQQLSADQVCLTGMKFFSITRNFMLTVAGTIVTYEVLLINSTQP